MKVVKFILKCILAATPIIAMLLFTILCPFCYMDEEYPAWRFTKDVVSGKELKDEYFDTLILGDSGAMSSFKPELLSDSCVNLAVGGGTPIEMYYFLEEYLENHQAPKHIVMMYAPFHYFTIDNYETRTMYFKSLRIKDLRELYKDAREKEVTSIYNEDTLLGDFSCRLGLPTKYLPAITAARFVGRYSDNKASYNELIKSRGYGPFGTADECDGESYECSYDTVPFDETLFLINEYIMKIDSLCAENGIEGVLVQPALNDATFEGINPWYKGVYERMMEDVIAASTSSFIVETKLRHYDSEYFGDVSHLNSKGADKFSKEIKELYPQFFGADS